MLLAALSALVFAATPAELCAECNEVRDLVGRYPVLAGEILMKCQRVIDLAPDAPCAEDARRAVGEASAALEGSRCVDCTRASTRLDGQTLREEDAHHLLALCGRVRETGPCNDVATRSIERAQRRLLEIASAHLAVARRAYGAGEYIRALEFLARARNLDPWDGERDFERMTYEKAVAEQVPVLRQRMKDAAVRGDEVRALELLWELDRAERALNGDFEPRPKVR